MTALPIPARARAPRAGMPAREWAGPAWTGFVAVLGAVVGPHLPAAGLLAVAVAAGLPHGAFDYDVGRRRFGGRSARWWLPFLAVYLGLMAATLFAWWAAPTLTLVIFFLLSAVHFGKEDTPAGSLHPMGLAAHGGAIIVAPALFHPTEFRRLTAMLIGPEAVTLQSTIAGPVAWLWSAALVATLARYVGGRPAKRLVGFDLMLVVTSFAIATPLVAFALYFALIHTTRAYAGLHRSLTHDRHAVGRAMLFSVLGLGLAGVLFRYSSSGSVSNDIVRTVFIMLSALTVPHMWLEFVSGDSKRPAARKVTTGLSSELAARR